MKIIIAYSSKYGTTKKVAEQISQSLSNHQAEVSDFKSITSDKLAKSDFVVLGTSIHIGKSSKSFIEFCNNNIETLLSKKLGLFMCGLEKEKFAEEFAKAFPKELINHSSINLIAGGEIIYNKLNFLERIILQKMKGVTTDIVELNETEIVQFAEKINKISL